MKMRQFLLNLGLIVLGFSTAFATYVPLRGDVQGDKPQIEVLRHSEDQMQIEVRLPGVTIEEGVLEGRQWDRVEIPGGGLGLDLGAPEVPHFSRLLAIPATAGVWAEFEALEIETLSNIELMPAQEAEPEELVDKSMPVRFDMAAYSQDALYPEEEVNVGEPALMRGLRVIPVQMNPVRYNPVSKDLRIAHRFRVTVHFEGTDLRNVPQHPMRPVSRSLAKLMRSVAMNFDELGLEEVPLGSYLIVCEDDTYLKSVLLQPLMDWKIRKGHYVAVESFTPNASQYAIKAIIQNAYDTWEIPPEYILLFGDTSGMYALPGWFPEGVDHPYSQLDGSDVLADVAVGRLPAESSSDAQMFVSKNLLYEKTPYTANSDWYHQGCLVAGSYISGLSTVQANRWIKTRMIWGEYTRIDTFWYWMGGSVAGTIVPAINDGVTFVNYRGWLGMEDFSITMIDLLTNGRMLPFVTTITCATGGFDGDSFMEHFVSVGTASEPKGAISCVGTATINTHTKYNNTVDVGIYAGIFDEDITQAGNALNRGKLELYNAYQAHDPGAVSSYSLWNALAGDPGLELFTHAIQYMSCDLPTILTLGENLLCLTVNEAGVGPVSDAVVCLYKADGLHEVGLTDANGQVTLPINVQTVGNVKVTITKQNFYPIVDSLDVVQAGVAVGYYNHSIDDDNSGTSSGDSDGIINPGETVEIPLVFKNYGSSTPATSVSVTATLMDEYVDLIDGYETFTNLAPGATANSDDDFDLTIADNCPHGHIVRLDLVTNSNQGSWDGLLDLEVISYDLNILSAYAAGSDTLLSPGESADFILEVSNNGGKEAASLAASLTSLDSHIIVNDNSASFGSITIGDTAICNADPFNLTANADTPPGHLAKLEVTFTSLTGATQTDTITIALGVKSQDDPQGPDEYGYYCFDNTDTYYAQAPIYDWVEIDTTYGGSGTRLPIFDTWEDLDASINIPLPFAFRYYGKDTYEITVCSNGWISIWANDSFNDFRNYPIPSNMGPNGLIAAFWDDLITWNEGFVYSMYDTANHRFIVEWSRVKNRGLPQPIETFEIILFDPIYYPTVTGDGEVLFQYNTITEVYGYSDDNPYSTVGIERPDKQDGIQVVYWNIYDDPAAAPLEDRRAYLFTTNFSYLPPGSNLYVTLAPYGAPVVVPSSGGNFDFNIEVGNISSTPIIADVWCDATLPDGSIVGPLLGPVTGFTLPGNCSTNRDRTQFVPAGAPAGTYSYSAYVGLYPDSVYYQDAFMFTKSGDDGSGDWENGWENMGESFLDQLDDDDEMTIPETYSLGQNYPNPFNPSTVLSFESPEASFVNLAIYDLSGRKVADLVNGWREAGRHEITFDGSGLASGIYIYHLHSSDFTASRKMVLVK